MNSADDVAANLARVRHWVGDAAQRGAGLVVLPENFAYFGDEAGKLAAAEPTDETTGPIVRTLVELASRHRVHIVGGGMPERSDDANRPYNCSLLVGPRGVVARYRKVHLFDVTLADGTVLEESRATHPGETDAATLARAVHPLSDGDDDASASGVLLGMSVCYDVRFPELYRAMSRAGARILTVPAAFTVTTGKDHWHVLLRARAIENQCFVLAAAQHGKHPRGRQTYGKSLIADPWGDVLAQAPEGEGIAVATLDFAKQDDVRRNLPALSHARLSQPA
jgi:predicted amidohydrolase